MTLRRFLQVTILITSLSGCFSPNIRHFRAPEKEKHISKITNNYRLGERKTVAVGEAIATHSERPVRQIEQLQLHAVEDITTPWGLIAKGERLVPSYRYMGTCTKGKYLLKARGLHQRVGLIVNENWEVVCRDAFLHTDPQFLDSERTWPIEGDVPRKVALERRETIEKELPGASYFELIYLGQFANTLRVGYREYRQQFGDYDLDGQEESLLLKRYVFDEELTYDLSRSRDIRFKDLRIRVHEMSNSSITYAVIAD